MRSSSSVRRRIAWQVTAIAAAGALLLSACVDDAVDDAPPEGDPNEGDEGTEDAAGIEFESVTLQYASIVPEDAAAEQIVTMWMEEVTSRTGGAVVFETFYTESLVPGPEVMEALGDGRTDLAFVANVFYPQDMPLQSITTFPWVATNAGAAAKAMNDLMESNELLRSEWETRGAKALFMIPPAFGSAAASIEIDSHEQLDGTRWRATGHGATIFERLGVDSVALPSSEVYESIQRDVVVGTFPFDWTNAVDFGLPEVAPVINDLQAGITFSPTVGISLQTWDSLDPEVQQIMTDVAAEMDEDFVRRLVDVEAEACDRLVDMGGRIHIMDDAAVDALLQASDFESLLNDWFVSAAEHHGVEPSDIESYFDEFVSSIESYESETVYEPGMEACAARS